MPPSIAENLRRIREQLGRTQSELGRMLGYQDRAMVDHYAPNPVRGIKKFREPDPQPRGYTYRAIRKILAAVQNDAARARLTVMAYTGLPPAQIGRIAPEHVEWRAGKVWVQGRQKGRGTVGRLYPLTADGLAALEQLRDAEAWGSFPSGLDKVFRTACKAAGETIGRPYDLRHSFATATYQVSDERAAMEFLDHRDPRTTRRYILGAIPTHIAAALPKLARLQRAPERGRNGQGDRGTRKKSA